MMKRRIALLCAAVLFLSAAAVSFADEWERVDEAPGPEERVEENEENDPEEDPEEPVEEGEETGPADVFENGAAQDIFSIPEDLQVPSQEDALWLRIGLKYGSSAVSASICECQDGFYIARIEDGEYVLTHDLTMYSAVACMPSDGGAALLGSDGTFITFLQSDQMLLSAAEDPDERIITIDEKQYRDGVSYIAAGDVLTVINRITLEHYLLGVIANEMGAYYPEEALKAQSVAARSFTVANLNKHRYYGFDLCDSTNCQVYRGVSSETVQTTAAVQATDDLVMRSEGKIASGMYYAYSSGHTLNSEDVWTTSSSYLKGITDEYAGEYIWRASVSFDTIKGKLQDLGYRPGDILSVQVKERLENTAVRSILIETDSGDFTVEKWSVVSALGGSSLVKSQFFYIGNSDYPQADDVLEGTVYTTGKASYDADEAFCVLGSDGIVHEIAVEDAYVTNGKTTLSAASQMNSSYSDEIAEDGTVYFTGFGFGHGVGMPQVSARNMANAGKSFRQILQYYYTDITIEHYSD